MRIGCGCVNLGSAASGRTWRDDIRLVRDAVDSGITLFDTADAYGSGSSERILGKALREERESITLSTKGGYVFRPRSRSEQVLRSATTRMLAGRRTARRGRTDASTTGRRAYVQQDFSPERLRQALHNSLKRLGTDYLDVYHLHGPDRVIDDALAELTDLRDAGTIRRLGVGTESVESAASWLVSDSADVIQFPFGVLDPGGQHELFPKLDSVQCELWARGILGGGLLSAAMHDPHAVANHPKNALIMRLASIAQEAAMRLDELAIRWARGFGQVDTMLVGISSPVHLARNQHLASLPALPEDIVAAIARAQAQTAITDAVN